MAGHALPATDRNPGKPTAKQLSYLRTLAIRTGQTFTQPATLAASLPPTEQLRP
jgi:hypothetical protein